MKFTEKKLIEDYICVALEKKGWRFVPADELERDSFEEPLLIPNLVRTLKRVNKNLDIGDEEINRVVNELKLTGTGVEGAKKILNFYKSGIPVKFEKDKVVHYIRLFDFDNIESNEFLITRQTYYQGRERIRTDILLYVNGLPLVNIECKNPASFSESWYDAYNQIKHYEKNVPELYKYVQIGVAVESQSRYFPIVPWQEEVKTHEWKVKGEDSVDAAIAMLSREILLDILGSFLFSRIEFGDATKVVTRYMQYRAANKMVNRVIRNLRGEEEKDRGLIWHWQGSGKTLTMIFAAHKLFFRKELANPTIFFIVDRVELERQLKDEFSYLDIFKPEIIGTAGQLAEVLRHDDYRGKRGVFITLIHKFRPEEFNVLQKELETVSASKETIMNRRNVVAFIDEGHRTQYGLMAAQMKSLLKRAFFFALTGTPIAKKERNTYAEFSYPPEELYLDRYFVTESLNDRFTVKIVYQPRLEDKVHLKKDQLEAFLKTEFEELPEEIREKIEERVKKKLNAIKLILEKPERIGMIAADIARHYRENVDGKFKAMVVAGSRKACAIYKGELDKHLPEEYSEVITTFERNDEEAILKYVAESKARYGGRDIEDIRKNHIDRFKEEDLPKILIVTDMLLTGFDVPVLQVMYLDKLLKEHRLLQAVARTNRPWGDLKEAGLVIDYVGILKEFQRAFEMYSKEDIEEAFNSYDSLREDFIAKLEGLVAMIAEVPKDYERETLLRAIEILTADEEKGKEFVGKYKELRRVFELLGPDEIKLTYFEDYKWLSAVYQYYVKVVVQTVVDEVAVRKYYDKTIRFVYETTEIEKLNRELPAIAFDEQYLEALEERVKSREEKAANILFTLNKLILVDRHRNPVYESLVERVERLLQMWKEKTRDYERIYREGAGVIGEIHALFARKNSLGFSDLEYALLLELEKMLDRGMDCAKLVNDLAESLEPHTFPGWSSQITARKEVEREIRKFARGLKGKYDLSLDKMNDMHKMLTESMKNYGV